MPPRRGKTPIIRRPHGPRNRPENRASPGGSIAGRIVTRRGDRVAAGAAGAPSVHHCRSPRGFRGARFWALSRRVIQRHPTLVTVWGDSGRFIAKQSGQAFAEHQTSAQQSDLNGFRRNSQDISRLTG